MQKVRRWLLPVLLVLVLVGYIFIAPGFYQNCREVYQEDIHDFLFNDITIIAIGFVLAVSFALRIKKGVFYYWKLSLLLFLFILFAVISFGIQPAAHQTINGLKASGVSLLRAPLKIYKLRHGKFPNSLDELFKFEIDYNRALVEEETLNSYKITRPYFYGVSDDGEGYVLGAQLKYSCSTYNPRSKVEGNIYGLECGGEMYCIKYP